MKIVIVLALFAILASLASALFFMMRSKESDGGNDHQRANHMVRALTVRIGLSVTLFLLLLAAWKLGYIHPTGLPAVPQ